MGAPWVFSGSLWATVFNHIPASKAGICFTRKEKKKSKSKPHLLYRRQRSTVLGSQSTYRIFICQLGHYAYQGLYTHSYDITSSKLDKSTHCLTLTIMHSQSNCCVDKNFTGNWLAPSQMPTTVVINTSF